MILEGERHLRVPVARVWSALNDPDFLRDCIQGCEMLERVADNKFDAVVSAQVGPISARFKGTLEMTDIDPPHAYILNFEGQGGMAGFGKGAARVTLTPQESGTLLTYRAEAKIGGKIMQIGSRVIDAAAGKVANDFFTAFETNLTATAGACPAEEPKANGANIERGALSKMKWLAIGVLVIGLLLAWAMFR